MLQGCAAVSKCLGTRGSKPSHFTSNQHLEGGNRPLRDIHFILSHFFIFSLSVSGRSKTPGTSQADNLLHQEVDILLITSIQGSNALFHDGDTRHLC